MDLSLVKAYLFFITGGVLVFLAITVTRDNLGHRLNRVAGAMLLFAGIGPLLAGIATIAGGNLTPEATGPYNLYLVWEFFFPFLVYFSWLFPVNRLRYFRWPQFRYLIFVPVLLHLWVAFYFDDLASLLSSFRIDPSDQGFFTILLKPLSKLATWMLLLVGLAHNYQREIFSVLNLGFVATAGYFLESGRKHVVNPSLLPQTNFLVWTFRLGVGLYALAQAGAVLGFWTHDGNVHDLLVILALLFSTWLLTYATVRHQFLDVRFVFRQSLVYTVSSAILVGTYILIVVKSPEILAPIFGDRATLISYVLIIFMLLLFQPINNRLDNLIKSMFIRTRTDHRNIMERFSRQVISMFNPEQLRQIIEETLKTSLLVEKVYFVLYDDEIQEYALLVSEDNSRRAIVASDDLILRRINQMTGPGSVQSLSDYMDNSELAAILIERKTKLILPLKEADHLLGFVALTDKVAGYRYSAEDYSLLGILSNQMVTALINARLYVESLERVRLQEEVSMARQIQVDLLPSSPPTIDCLSIGVHAVPSRTVGGDFYDFITTAENHLGIVIADASGKGMPAALMIAQIQAIIRSEINNGSSIDRMLVNMNRQILNFSSPEKYVTLFYGQFDPQSRKLYYANAGHNYPILARADGSIELLETGGPIIGALPDMEYRSTEITLDPNDILFLFTDGLSEARNEKEEEYGEERLIELIKNNRTAEAQDLIDLVLRDVHSHDPSYPPRDDTTIIVLKINGTPY